jgi:hypothetical protein
MALQLFNIALSLLSCGVFAVNLKTNKSSSYLLQWEVKK